MREQHAGTVRSPQQQVSRGCSDNDWVDDVEIDRIAEDEREVAGRGRRGDSSGRGWVSTSGTN